jgi:hypothetical protein
MEKETFEIKLNNTNIWVEAEIVHIDTTSGNFIVRYKNTNM